MGDPPPAEGSAPADSTAPEASASAEPPAEPAGPPPGTPSLPAVNVKNVGLHVGGGPNDAASKAPFLRAIERAFPEFQRCYRLVAEPGKEGTFGVDLHVPKGGGTARVEQPRTGIEGDEFRACMIAAFEKVAFEPTPKPVVISYSVRFSLEP